MDFQFTEEQNMMRQSVREFAAKEILPKWRHFRKKEFPWDIHKKMIGAGYAGATIPVEYGGQGLGLLDFIIFVEELCRADAGTGLSIGASLSLVAKPIEIFGNEAQKKLWLPQFAKGAIGAYGQTEPQAGSDVAAIQTKGVCKDSELIISGTKHFITNGSIADIILAIVRTGKDRHKGLTMVIIDAKKAHEEKTLFVDKDFDKLGLHCSPTSTLTFDKCRVPIANIVGTLGKGFAYAMATLVGSRAMIAAQGVGIAQAALDEAITYTTTREQFGKKLAELPAVQRDLALMYRDIEAARILTYQAAWETETQGIAQSRKFAHKTSVAKHFASEVATSVALKSLILHGGMGFMAESRISAIYEDASVLHVYEGTDHIQEHIIARELLKDHGINI